MAAVGAAPMPMEASVAVAAATDDSDAAARAGRLRAPRSRSSGDNLGNSREWETRQHSRSDSSGDTGSIVDSIAALRLAAMLLRLIMPPPTSPWYDPRRVYGFAVVVMLTVVGVADILEVTRGESLAAQSSVLSTVLFQPLLAWPAGCAALGRMPCDLRHVLRRVGIPAQSRRHPVARRRATTFVTLTLLLYVGALGNALVEPKRFPGTAWWRLKDSTAAQLYRYGSPMAFVHIACIALFLAATSAALVAHVQVVSDSFVDVISGDQREEAGRSARRITASLAHLHPRDAFVNYVRKPIEDADGSIRYAFAPAFLLACPAVYLNTLSWVPLVLGIHFEGNDSAEVLYATSWAPAEYALMLLMMVPAVSVNSAVTTLAERVSVTAASASGVATDHQASWGQGLDLVITPSVRWCGFTLAGRQRLTLPFVARVLSLASSVLLLWLRQ